MPNIWAHFIFGQEVVKAVGGTSSLLQPPLRNVFNLGCQGPDFLFYHNYLPWKRDKRMTKLGSAMHSCQCGPMLLEMVSLVKGRDVEEPSVVYVLGFLMHHVLDRNMHPYVFYKSGFRKWDHQRFEVAMDTLIVRQKLGLETSEEQVVKHFSIGKEGLAAIVPIVREASMQCYPELMEKAKPADWQQAFLDMMQAQKLFHDPSGLKRVLTFGQMEPMVYKRNVADVDYLNEARKEWRHPAMQEQTSTLSVWDMWELALEDGEAVMRAALAVILGGANYSKLHKLLGNVSYETGLPCESKLEIRFADPII